MCGAGANASPVRTAGIAGICHRRRPRGHKPLPGDSFEHAVASNVRVPPMSSPLAGSHRAGRVPAAYRKNCETPGLASVSSIEATRRRYRVLVEWPLRRMMSESRPDAPGISYVDGSGLDGPRRQVQGPKSAHQPPRSGSTVDVVFDLLYRVGGQSADDGCTDARVQRRDRVLDLLGGQVDGRLLLAQHACCDREQPCCCCQ